MNFRDTIGHAIEAAASGAVGTAKSLMAYAKQLVTTTNDLHDTDIPAINTNIGSFSGQTNLQTLLAALGIPDVAGKSLYVCLITDRLDDATNGLAAVKTAVTDVNSDIGDYSAQTNLKSLLASLGVPDVAGKSLYVCLITDRLDDASYGLSAIAAKIDAGFALTGDAVVANVLDGKFFYKDNYQTKLEGTMPNNAGDVACESAHMDAGTVLHVVPKIGYTDGSDDATTIDLTTVDADLATGNIKSGVTILGVAGKTEVVDTTEAGSPAAEGDIASGKVAFVNGVKITGTHV